MEKGILRYLENESKFNSPVNIGTDYIWIIIAMAQSKMFLFSNVLYKIPRSNDIKLCFYLQLYEYVDINLVSQMWDACEQDVKKNILT
jgi:hypothetical protein